jgi:type II secretory pathway component PulJ
VVLGVIYGALDSALTSEAFSTDRTAALDDMRLTLNQMTRELRQATAVDEPASTSSRIEFDTYGGGAPRHVVYQVSGTNLTRTVNSGTAVTVLRRLATPQIFTYVSAPPVPGAQWVRINLQVHPQRTPDTVLVLDSEVNLRNRTGALS